ncbi:MAG: YfhO family protein [Blautia sp.]|nr:YfhO family protein [Blautia sp.]MCM1200953.1 YfhO family protein [Bacteroides fragilis]
MGKLFAGRIKEIATVCVIYIFLLLITFFPVIFGKKSLYPMTYLGRSTAYLVGDESIYEYLMHGGTYVDAGAADWVEIPIVAAANSCIAHGEMPLWDVYSSMGMPIIDNNNGSTLAPFAWLLSINDSEAMWNFVYLARLFIMMIFTYFFFREMQIGKLGSFTGGFVFGFSGYVILYMDIFFLHVDTFLPMLMWASLHYKNKHTIKNWILVTLSIVFMCLGGNPQNLITGCLLAVSYYLFLTCAKQENVRRVFRKEVFIDFFQYLAAYIFAVALTMGYWLSFITLYLNCHSYHGHAGMSIKSIKEFMGFILPVGLFDHTRRGLLMPYLGVMVCIFIVSQIIIKKNRKFFAEKIFFVGFIILFSLKILGFPLINWIGKLPILSNLSFTKYNAAIYFGVACLVAMIFDDMLREVNIRRKFITCFLVLLCCIVALLNNHFNFYNMNELVVTYLRYMEVIYVFIIGIMLICILYSNVKLFIFACSGLIVLELMSYPMFQNIIRIDKETAFHEPEFVEVLKSSRENDYDRVFCLNGLLMGNMSAIYEICSLNGISPTPEIHYWNFMNELVLDHNLDLQMVTTESNVYVPSSKRYLDLLGVQYVLTDNYVTIEDPDLIVIYEGDGVTIYHNNSACNKAFAVHNLLYSDCEETSLQYLKEDIDLSMTAVIETEDDGDIEIGQSAGSVDEIEIVEYNNNSVVIECAMEENGLLILSDLYYPGWKVYVDGVEDKVIRTDDILRGVYLTAGEHDVRFVYKPGSLKYGIAISIGSIVIFILVLVIKRKKETVR